MTLLSRQNARRGLGQANKKSPQAGSFPPEGFCALVCRDVLVRGRILLFLFKQRAFAGEPLLPRVANARWRPARRHCLAAVTGNALDPRESY
jgi:hypothetical protein